MALEWLLNSAMNRFQLNFSRNVGKVSASIRLCSPQNIDEWQDYYFENVRTKEHLIELGKKLYVKITEVISAEVADITEEDCVGYIQEVVIKRTFDGYTTEIKTIYGQLEVILGCEIIPATDNWDRLYNVDFYIEVCGKQIGLQIKPVSDVSHIPQIYQEHTNQIKSHQKFKEKYGGSVFYIYSFKEGQTKKIHNIEIIEEIRNEKKDFPYENLP